MPIGGGEWTRWSISRLKSIKQKFQSPQQPDQVPQARRLGSMEPQVLIQAAHRHTTATLRDRAARIVETVTKTENRV
jgi:hypothetical protein